MAGSSLDAALDRLRSYRQSSGLSQSAFAQAAGLSRAALVGMDNPDWAPSSTTIRALEALIPADWQGGDHVPAEAASEAAS